MKGPKHYDRALVPEHLTKQTIEMLPFDRAYYISPGEQDDYEPPTIFVTPDRKLVMSKSSAIDMDDDIPASPIGLVGVMHVTYTDPASQTLRDAYVADLRFIGDNALVDIDPGSCDVDTQEEYMSYVNMLADAIEFDAFIAPEPFADVNDDGSIPGVYYGNPILHPELKKLRKRGNKLMRRFMQRDLPTGASTKAGSTELSPTQQPQVSEDKNKKPAYLTSPFSNGQ
jgi:hypothetical protein